MGLTWWQSLLIGCVPALIASIALLWQSKQTLAAGERKAALDREHTIATARNDRRLNVHSDAISLLNKAFGGAMPYVTPSASGNPPAIRPEAEMRHTEDLFVMHARLIMSSEDRVAQAFWHAATEYDTFVSNVLTFNSESGSGAPSAREVKESYETAVRLRNRYILLAQTETGLFVPAKE